MTHLVQSIAPTCSWDNHSSIVSPLPNHIMERLRVDLLEQEVGINIDIEWDSLGSRLGLSEGEVRELAGMRLPCRQLMLQQLQTSPFFKPLHLLSRNSPHPSNCLPLVHHLHTLLHMQTLDFSLTCSIKSEYSNSTDKQSHTFAKDTDPPSPPNFPAGGDCDQETTMVPTKRRSIPRPSAPGLLKPSTTASNIPKSSASGLSKGGAGTRTKGLSKLPRTNTRTGILRAQVS